jgi:hypothetical protein
MLNSEILEYFENVPCLKPYFLGVFSIDNFPKKLNERSCFISNMSKSSEIGSHWISFIKSDRKTIEIFDSLGTKIDILKPFLTFKGNPTILFNDCAFQSLTSNTCGYFAITFLIERSFNLDLKYKEVLAETFNIDSEINETMVVDFCKNL